MTLEVCCGNLESVHAAVKGGAPRIELCSRLDLDGLSPLWEELEQARALYPTLKIHALIRPREGDFCYGPEEAVQMQADIEKALELGADGIDIGAQYGASIVAAYSGTVVAATYNASMGNYIMIDHGDGLYTIYMHASALYVSTGQEVTAGQNIAAVGSTGRSTGPHLHFGVRLNGSYVSPWNYLK